MSVPQTPEYPADNYIERLQSAITLVNDFKAVVASLAIVEFKLPFDLDLTTEEIDHDGRLSRSLPLTHGHYTVIPNASDTEINPTTEVDVSIAQTRPEGGREHHLYIENFSEAHVELAYYEDMPPQRPPYPIDGNDDPRNRFKFGHGENASIGISHAQLVTVGGLITNLQQAFEASLLELKPPEAHVEQDCICF